MNDTLLRQWLMLRMIPRHPAKIATSELRQLLADEGFDATQRTLQRDLQKLSIIYPLSCDERCKPYGWSWAKDAGVLDIPGMDSHMALAFWLAKKHLDPILPNVTSNRLQAHFKAAANILDTQSVNHGVPAWRDKVRVLQRGPKLGLPVIDEAVQEVVYEALLQQHRLEITYCLREDSLIKIYEVNPLGLVLKNGVSYLVCSLWDYSDIRLLVLHRMSNATLLDETVSVPSGFNLDNYIASGELGFQRGGAIKLRALFTSDSAFHLSERPLSEDQFIKEHSEHRVLVSATVQDTSELLWWLLGFGNQVEVLKPIRLRKQIAEIVHSMAEMYAL